MEVELTSCSRVKHPMHCNIVWAVEVRRGHTSKQKHSQECRLQSETKAAMRYNICWDKGTQCNTSHMYVDTGEKLFIRSKRRASDRRTQSNRAKIPRGRPTSREQQWSIQLVTMCEQEPQSHSWWGSRRPLRVDGNSNYMYVQLNFHVC